MDTGYAEHTSGNLYAQLSDSMPHEMIEALAQGENFRLERIVSLGHTTPPGQWYDQDADEWVVLLSGSARLLFEDGKEYRNLKPGDWLLIQAHHRHRVEWTDQNCHTLWLALHFTSAVNQS